jgi:hypothetical protein
VAAYVIAGEERCGDGSFVCAFMIIERDERTPMPQVAQTEDEKQDTVVQTKEKW